MIIILIITIIIIVLICLPARRFSASANVKKPQHGHQIQYGIGSVRIILLQVHPEDPEERAHILLIPWQKTNSSEITAF